MTLRCLLNPWRF
ncbi:putative membrane protein, partial [Escherichia coli PA23]